VDYLLKRAANCAALAHARGEGDEAARLFASGTQRLYELGVALDPDDQAELDWLTQELAP
jgi:hypothetical protein